MHAVTAWLLTTTYLSQTHHCPTQQAYSGVLGHLATHIALSLVVELNNNQLEITNKMEFVEYLKNGVIVLGQF